MSTPCLHSASVATRVPSTSRIASVKNAEGCWDQTRSRVSISDHRQSRWYEEGPLKGPSVEAQLALVPILVEVRSLTEGPLAPGVLSSHSLGVHFTWDRLGPSGHGRPHVPRCLPRGGPSQIHAGNGRAWRSLTARGGGFILIERGIS